MTKGLTLTIVFDGMSLNYGEGVGNISELKKISRGGEFYSYLSRQAIRYDIYRMLKENFSIDADKEDPLHKAQGVIQFKPEANIRDYIEVDLFGYMKTAKGGASLTRSAVVRITPAISLEPMYSDIEFGTNKILLIEPILIQILFNLNTTILYILILLPLTWIEWERIRMIILSSIPVLRLSVYSKS
jgi:CRISPR-associated autoregulator DevR family